jgi:CRP-like cAMP-binding protein
VYIEADAEKLAVVLEGLLRVYMHASDGRQVTVRYAREGGLVGVPALIGGPAPVFVQAVTSGAAFFFNIDRVKVRRSTMRRWRGRSLKSPFIDCTTSSKSSRETRSRRSASASYAIFSISQRRVLERAASSPHGSVNRIVATLVLIGLLATRAAFDWRRQEESITGWRNFARQ